MTSQRAGTRASKSATEVVVLAALLWLVTKGAGAQERTEDEDVTAGEVRTEEVDSTRLDVSRLPPEAIEVTRDLYARGFFVEAMLGATGFLGDLGDVSKPGPRLAVNFGYELASWVSVLIQGDISLHDTKNRPPPASTVFEMVGASGGVRLSVPFNARAALWADGLVGIAWTGGDVLHALGFKNAVKPSLAYGGELGFDWHVLARHHSFGVLAGTRVFPQLVRNGYSLSLYGSAYLRYVF